MPPKFRSSTLKQYKKFQLQITVVKFSKILRSLISAKVFDESNNVQTIAVYIINGLFSKHFEQKTKRIRIKFRFINQVSDLHRIGKLATWKLLQ